MGPIPECLFAKGLPLRPVEAAGRMRAMTRNRWFLVAALTALVGLAVWMWWGRPRQVDMASYAPASSLLYLEANNPMAVAEALSQTDAWKIVEQMSGADIIPHRPWLEGFVRWTGIGPVESVILARAQVAVVVTDLGATEIADALRVKPEATLIIETKTSEGRIRAPVEKAIQKLAELTYNKPVFHRTVLDGTEFMEWTAPGGSRQIVATISGSLVIIGNTRKAVESCLSVSRGHGPSLKDDPELTHVRLQLGSDQSLSFGYVPAANSARLLSIGLPLLLGRAPANSEFQRLIATAAAKVVGSLGWSARPFTTGIEDRFVISLQPSVVARLKPSFTGNSEMPGMNDSLPDSLQSVTFYKFQNSLGAWQDLKGAVASEVDALSAIFFSSLLKSALLPFGIEEPESFLASVEPGILTLRPDPGAERSLLIARVKDESGLRALLAKTMRTTDAGPTVAPTEIIEDAQGESAAGFISGLVVMGPPAEVRSYIEALRTRTRIASPDALKRMAFFTPTPSPSSVVTYVDDADRVRSFVSAVIAAKRITPATNSRVDEMIARLPYAATETTMGESGLERTTRSPLGQFSSLLALLIPEQRTP